MKDIAVDSETVCPLAY